MKRYLIILVVIILGSGCKKKVSDNCGDADLDCSGINCFLITYDFTFRIVDKTTGADLVFGSNPRYTTSDIQLYYDAAATRPISLTVDNSNRFFHTIFSKNEMYLVIKNGTPAKLNVEFRMTGCCSQKLKTLSINGESVCTCCNDVVEVRVN